MEQIKPKAFLANLLLEFRRLSSYRSEFGKQLDGRSCIEAIRLRESLVRTEDAMLECYGRLVAFIDLQAKGLEESAFIVKE